MAVIFMDGFDAYTTADWLKRWTTDGSANNVASVNPTYARTMGGQGMQLIASAGQTAPTKMFGTNYAQGIIGFAFYATGLASKTLLTILDGATEQCSLRINGSNIITVNQGATVKATGSSVLSSSTWHYVEFKFTAHGSAGVAEVKLNGAAEIASTGSLDLAGTANNYWSGFGLPAGSASPTTSWWDDFYVLDPTTGSNTDFLGPVRAVVLSPAAPGNAASWTPNGGTNYGCISERYQDADTSFNQSSTANQIDSFVMQDLPADSGSVYAVQTLITARQDAGAARTIAPVLRPASTDRVGTTVALSTSYQTLTQIYDLNPEDSAAWETADVAGMEVGYKLVS
jgi:hypothetical protein